MKSKCRVIFYVIIFLSMNSKKFPLLSTGKFLLFLALFTLPACFEDEGPEHPFEINLYTGVPGIARLSETYQQVTEKAKYKWEKIAIDEAFSKKLGITDGVSFPTMGVNVFFKRKSAAIIILQPPFKGRVMNKKISIFDKNAEINEWDKHLLKEFGTPEAKSSGGRLNAEIVFHSWGDITYTRVGPIEMTLYRDTEIKNYRINNFSSGQALFPGSK